jgi:hypothetical protein
MNPVEAKEGCGGRVLHESCAQERKGFGDKTGQGTADVIWSCTRLHDALGASVRRWKYKALSAYVSATGVAYAMRSATYPG